MKVILLQDVRSLGKKGDIVEVNDGYARNFLLKTKKGVEANNKNMNDLKLHKANQDKIAQEQLGWKRTTTYTVLKRLCDKGYLKNEASVVTALVDRATVQRADGQEVLQRSFQGSLPSFLAAFLQAGTVSDQEAEEIAQMLDDYRHSH